MAVDVSHGGCNHFRIHAVNHLVRANPGIQQIMLPQHRVHSQEIPIAGRVPHDLVPVVNPLGFQQRLPDPRVGVRSVVKIERPVELLNQRLDIAHAENPFRFKQEQIPAAPLTHGQGMGRLRRKDQDFSLVNMIDRILHHVVHHALQRQADLHGGMIMNLISPGNVGKPDPHGRIVRIGHIFPPPLHHPEAVFITGSPKLRINPFRF